MLWDAPKYKGYELDNQWCRVKYIAQVVFLFGGIFFANEMSSDAIPPPQYKDLLTTKGQLTKVILKDVRGRNVSLIEVSDIDGGIWVFPKGSKHLFLSITGLQVLKNECLGKKISVKWVEVKKIFFGSKIDVWEIFSCDKRSDINFDKKIDFVNKRYVLNKKIVNLSLIVSFLSFLSFIFNYRLSKKILKSKEYGN